MLGEGKKMPFTPDEMVMDLVKLLKDGNGGTITIGYRPESGTETRRVPARWEMIALTGGEVGQDTVKLGAVGNSFEEAMDKLLSNISARWRTK
jgi:hypothetical protein